MLLIQTVWILILQAVISNVSGLTLVDPMDFDDQYEYDIRNYFYEIQGKKLYLVRIPSEVHDEYGVPWDVYEYDRSDMDKGKKRSRYRREIVKKDSPAAKTEEECKNLKWKKEDFSNKDMKYITHKYNTFRNRTASEKYNGQSIANMNTVEWDMKLYKDIKKEVEKCEILELENKDFSHENTKVRVINGSDYSCKRNLFEATFSKKGENDGWNNTLKLEFLKHVWLAGNEENETKDNVSHRLSYGINKCDVSTTIMACDYVVERENNTWTQDILCEFCQPKQRKIRKMYGQSASKCTNNWGPDRYYTALCSGKKNVNS